MIKTLVLKDFVKHENLTISFKEGFTAIQGANGAGKTLLLEAVGFALFGSKALRGKVEEYPKTLSVTLELVLRDNEVKVERSLSKCSVIVDGKMSCVGNKESTLFIQSLFGYNKTVFDFANVSLQGETNRLGRCTPSERKSAIDSLLGMKNIDVLISRYKTLYKEANAQCEGILSVVPSKEERPQLPDKYEDKEFMSNKLEEIKTLTFKRSALEETISKIVLPEIKVPTCPKAEDVDLKIKLINERRILGRLKELESKRSEVQSYLNAYKRVPIHCKEFFEHQVYLNEHYIKLPTCPKPSLTLKEIEDGIKKCLIWNNYENAKTQKCPTCGSLIRFGFESEVEKPEHDISFYRREQSYLTEWSKIPDGYDESLEAPSVDLKTALSELSYLERRSSYDEKVKAFDSLVKEINGLNESLEEIDKLKKFYEKCFFEWKEYESKLSTLESLKNSLTDFQKELDDCQKRLKEELEKYSIESLTLSLNRFNEYESEMKRYEEQESLRKRLLEQADVYMEKQRRFEKILNGLTTVKKSVKNFVVPSIVKVSSALVKDMSEGTLSNFSIDEDFEIYLDGRRLVTFSGSEEVIANIALRIALGQILTRGVFSTLWFDEPDASCSQERSEEVMRVLRKLTKTLKQVIVISHKEIQADEYVRL